MRRLPLLLAILAAGLAAWWLTRPSPAPLEVGGAPAGVEEAPAAPPRRAVVPPAAAGARLATAPPAPRRAPKPEAPPKGSGDLRVRLKVEGDAPAAVTVRLDLEALRPTPESPRLPIGQEDGSWLWGGVPAGRYRVLATVPGYVLARAEASVAPDDETVLEIPLEPGAEIGWKVVFPGEAPDTVRLALLDARGRRVEASYRTAATTVHVPADRVISLPLEGRILGLRPGAYRLRAESPAGESDEQDVVAEPGKPGEVELHVRR